MDLILRGDGGGIGVVEIVCDHSCERGKLRLCQQTVDHRHIYAAGVKVPGRLRRKAELFDRVVFPVRHIRSPEKEVRGYAEEFGERQHHVVIDRLLFAALDPTEQGFRKTGFLRDGLVCHAARSLQINDPVPNAPRQILFFTHVPRLLDGFYRNSCAFAVETKRHIFYVYPNCNINAVQ